MSEQKIVVHIELSELLQIVRETCDNAAWGGTYAEVFVSALEKRLDAHEAADLFPVGAYVRITGATLSDAHQDSVMRVVGWEGPFRRRLMRQDGHTYSNVCIDSLSMAAEPALSSCASADLDVREAADGEGEILAWAVGIGAVVDLDGLEQLRKILASRA